MSKGKKISHQPVKKKQKITKGTIIGDLIKKYPESAEILAKHGFHCIGCILSPYETLEAGAAVHGVPIGPLLKEINQKI